MTTIGIIILMVLGMLLIMAELFFLMGGSIAIGLAGLAILGVGVYQIFMIHGMMAGCIALLGSTIGGVGMTLAAFRMMSTRDIGLREQIDGRVNEVDHTLVQVDDVGLAYGDLKLGGQIKVMGEIMDAESEDGFIAKGTKVIVTKVTSNKVFVKKLEEDK